MTQGTVIAAGLDCGHEGRLALGGVDFSAEQGVRVALLGPNGGGKSTLIRTLSGEIPPLAGSFALSGRPGVVPQHDPGRKDWPATALDVVTCGTLGNVPWWRPPGRAERHSALAALAAVGLEHLASVPYGDLSGGQRRRTQIAAALAGGSRVLLLDEPFAGLDNVSASELEQLIARLAEGGSTILVATHDLEQASSWELVLCLNGEQVAFGPPSEALTRVNLERTFGEEIVELPDGTLLAPPHHHDHDH